MPFLIFQYEIFFLSIGYIGDCSVIILMGSYLCRRLQAFRSMAGAEGLEPSARGFGGNVEFSLTLRLLRNFGDLLPAAPLMLQELMLF